MPLCFRKFYSSDAKAESVLQSFSTLDSNLYCDVILTCSADTIRSNKVYSIWNLCESGDTPVNYEKKKK